MKTTLADELLYSTINLVRVSEGRVDGSGTGFFWTIFLGNDRQLTLIVTNKHVVEGADCLVVRCHEANEDRTGPSGTWAECGLQLNRECIVFHPDAAVDLCAIPIGPFINQADGDGKPLFYKSIEAQNVPDGTTWETFDSIEDVLMVGCPRGIYDQFNNLPIVRRGITATPLGRLYNGRPEFMVDMACFPGSSGSPVFMLQRSYTDRETGYLNFGGRFYFLGVLYCGPVITNDGEVILSENPRVAVQSMMHLGQVIRSTAVLELEAEIRRVFAAPAISAQAAYSDPT